MKKRLFRTARHGAVTFVGITFWAETTEDARWYSRTLGPEGPAMYETELETDSPDVLDLTANPWGTIESQLGIGRQEYGKLPEFGRELLSALAPVFCARGYNWVAFRDSLGTTWMYVGTLSLDALPAGP